MQAEEDLSHGALPPFAHRPPWGSSPARLAVGVGGAQRTKQAWLGLGKVQTLG